ncbi:unnamed protein product, partial [Amoebophrya sp. A25]|eukprot:GSA25T00023182001.1
MDLASAGERGSADTTPSPGAGGPMFFYKEDSPASPTTVREVDKQYDYDPVSDFVIVRRKTVEREVQPEDAGAQPPGVVNAEADKGKTGGKVPAVDRDDSKTSPRATGATSGGGSSGSSSPARKLPENWYQICQPRYHKWAPQRVFVDEAIKDDGGSPSKSASSPRTGELQGPGEGTPLRIFITVWNLHGKAPPADLTAWIPHQPSNPASMHHIYAIGTCESCQTIQQAIFCRKRGRVQQYENDLLRHLNRGRGSGVPDAYERVGVATMGAIHLILFAHRTVSSKIRGLRTSVCSTGYGNLVGNKGGVMVGFSVGRESFLFVNCHLPAHKSGVSKRRDAFKRILSSAGSSMKPMSVPWQQELELTPATTPVWDGRAGFAAFSDFADGRKREPRDAPVAIPKAAPAAREVEDSSTSDRPPSKEQKQPPGTMSEGSHNAVPPSAIDADADSSPEVWDCRG